MFAPSPSQYGARSCHTISSTATTAQPSAARFTRLLRKPARAASSSSQNVAAGRIDSYRVSSDPMRGRNAIAAERPSRPGASSAAASAHTPAAPSAAAVVVKVIVVDASNVYAAHHTAAAAPPTHMGSPARFAAIGPAPSVTASAAHSAASCDQPYQLTPGHSRVSRFSGAISSGWMHPFQLADSPPQKPATERAISISSNSAKCSSLARASHSRTHVAPSTPNSAGARFLTAIRIPLYRTEHSAFPGARQGGRYHIWGVRPFRTASFKI